MKLLLISVSCLVVIASPVRGETYKFDPTHSKIAFQLRHLLGTARGEFHKFSGTIDFDREHPDRSTVTAIIQVASIDTKIAKRDQHLRSADFFDAAKFPEITFRSRGVKRTGANSGDITGDLTMHGVTRPMTLHVKLASPITAESVPARTRWQVTTDPIHRKDFNLVFSGSTEAISGIGQEVVPAIEIEAVRAE
ncbi:MAG: protein yceI precursor [Verrucomicrobia bacterium]|nr:MAG: protein yceI precursor [Verrucomicrobiota bacterium]